MNKIYLYTFITMIAIISVINIAFYWTAKDTLIKNETEINLNISKNIKETVENNQKSVEVFEGLLSQRLYTDSLVINHQLPSDVKQVTHAQLQVLADQLKLEGIAVMVPDQKWFNLVQSTSSAEVGTNSKMWGDKWNRMFFQLINDKNVTLEPSFGEAYSHFWAAPVETSYNFPDKIFLTGYYYDGTKNYIIEPICNGQQLIDFQKTAGVDSAINRFMKNNLSIKEISVLNFNRLTGDFKLTPGELWKNQLAFHNREIIAGTYHYESPLDKTFATKAVQQNKTINRIVSIHGKQILQFFIPIQIEIEGNTNQYKTIIISSVDYSQISSDLRKDMIQMSLVVILCFIFCFVLIYLLFRLIRKQGKLLTEINHLYAEKVNTLYQTIREYRHDVTNHIFTLQGLLSLRKYSDAETYIKQLTKVNRETSAIVNIHIPAFIGLIQVKVAESIEKNIQFEYQFKEFEYLELDIEKTTNLVKVIGNLLNNSFYEVEKNEVGHRSVSITGTAEERKLQFRIQNNGSMIPSHLIEKIFEFGYTTKNEGSGIGLASAKKIIEQYKGSITVNSNQEWTTFTIELPLSKKEFVPASIRKEKSG
ncbi:GHKL domain-containing protein [Bacillus sp. BRMEA1]|uniref:sensor histidine kinase n=1 Tax=Neobacillus endophyticus TaxID=2738405 RepID=UPI0015653A05|nr:ATP-binding protein [Neobacillus endophyticus]NRD76807.1 GHKL domain-containing protein [Neobacillus endophyticus]